MSKNMKMKFVKKPVKKPVPAQRVLMAKASVNADFVRNSEQASEIVGKQPVSLRFQETFLTQSDVQLLKGPFAMNDRLVGFYCAYMQNRRYKMQPEMYFLTPALTRSLRSMEWREWRQLVRDLQLQTKQFIFLPVSDSSHWSLLLLSRPDRKIFYFDSEDFSHVLLARLLAERLCKSVDAEQYPFTVGRCLQQAPNQEYESGVHLMCMTDNMADYVFRCGYASSTLLVSFQEVKAKRGSLLHLIRTLGGILPTSNSKQTFEESCTA